MAKGIKTGGRVKGVLNRDVKTLKDKAAELGVDPFEVLLLFAKEDWQALGYEGRTTQKFSPQGIEFDAYVIDPSMRLKAAAEACQYMHPKRKAVEQTVDPELLEMFKSLENKTEDELDDILSKLKK